MAETRRLSEHYSEIGNRLIREDDAFDAIRGSDATIVFLASDYPKKSHGRPICGMCEIVPDKWKWAVPADYAVTVYEPNVQGFTDEQLEILLTHELMHVWIDCDKDGEPVYRIAAHDLEDFRAIISRYGVDWGRVG